MTQTVGLNSKWCSSCDSIPLHTLFLKHKRFGTENHSSTLTWTLQLPEMIRGLWLRTHREILRHCGNNCLWLQRNPPVPLCPVYQSEHLRHPAQLSCGKSRLSLVHSLPQTVTPRPRSITTQQQETDYLILILLTNATCLHFTSILQSSFINYLMKHVTIYATDSLFQHLARESESKWVGSTSSYMNWSVSADLPTPPLPTMITLWMTLIWLVLCVLLIFTWQHHSAASYTFTTDSIQTESKTILLNIVLVSTGLIKM